MGSGGGWWLVCVNYLQWQQEHNEGCVGCAVVVGFAFYFSK